MWAVDQPPVTVGETAKACAKSIRDRAVKQALVDAVPALDQNSARYQDCGAGDRLHSVMPDHYRVPGVSDEQMRVIYDRQLVRQRASGRDIYMRLVNAAPAGLCAYCRYGVASTLDHFVPKSKVGGLSIEPWNLIPCCAMCNQRLGAAWSDDPTIQMLHPFFIGDLGRWLYASVSHQNPPAASFFVEPAATIEPAIGSRMRRQFDELNLAQLFSVVCGPELAKVDAQLQKSRLGAAHDVREFLAESAAAWFVVDPNDRRGALYEALSQDGWFTARYAVDTSSGT